MTREDFAQLERVAPHLTEFRTVGVFSPIREGERKIFPNATALPLKRWDLNKPGNERFDVLIASNVFMYSKDPARWFRHVLGSCKYFLMLDLVRRRRAKSTEFGADRDSMRYAIGEARPRAERHFDLATLGERLLGYRTFMGGVNAFDSDPLHVIALFRGDLADPILRVDDYPTGIRPILADLSPLHEILRKIEARRLQYYLGIVPALMTDDMFGFLNGLEHMIPSVHGYDHGYPKYAPLLKTKGDPFNHHTVGSFNEFKGQPYRTILAHLREGRQLVQERLGKSVVAYIPPGNMGDRRTTRALVEAGFDLYLSEKRLPACPLKWIRSDFYGRSIDYDCSRGYDIVSLHVTWEWDVVRQGEAHHLDLLLDDLASRKQMERHRGIRLGAIVGQADGGR